MIAVHAPQSVEDFEKSAKPRALGRHPENLRIRRSPGKTYLHKVGPVFGWRTPVYSRDILSSTGTQPPIHYYREKQLETEVVCTNCTLRYSVYGAFAFCPDCGQYNSIQILDKNLEVVEKMLERTTGKEKILAERLIENALEDCVSAFDGFGRELCRVHMKRARTPAKAGKMNCQNLEAARKGGTGDVQDLGN